MIMYNPVYCNGIKYPNTVWVYTIQQGTLENNWQRILLAVYWFLAPNPLLITCKGPTGLGTGLIGSRVRVHEMAASEAK